MSRMRVMNGYKIQLINEYLQKREAVQKLKIKVTVLLQKQNMWPQTKKMGWVIWCLLNKHTDEEYLMRWWEHFDTLEIDIHVMHFLYMHFQYKLSGEASVALVDDALVL